MDGIYFYKPLLLRRRQADAHELGSKYRRLLLHRVMCAIGISIEEYSWCVSYKGETISLDDINSIICFFRK